MASVPSDLQAQIDRIGSDCISGATALVLRGIQILRRAAVDGELLRTTALALCFQQPSMAGFRTAAALAVAAADPVGALDRLTHRIERTPPAVARLAVPLLQLRVSRRRPLRVVTCSRSHLVEVTLKALAAAETTEVMCAESRPGREGLGLAASLAAAGAAVELYSDAAIGTAIPTADVLVLGADALTSGFAINKVGSAALAALARFHGCAVTVLAGREKILPPVAFETLAFREGPRSEVSDITVGTMRNPYFETVAAGLIDQVVTDRGVIPMDEVLEATLWDDGTLQTYMSMLQSGNMLDKD